PALVLDSHIPSPHRPIRVLAILAKGLARVFDWMGVAPNVNQIGSFCQTSKVVALFFRKASRLQISLRVEKITRLRCHIQISNNNSWLCLLQTEHKLFKALIKLSARR